MSPLVTATTVSTRLPNRSYGTTLPPRNDSLAAASALPPSPPTGVLFFGESETTSGEQGRPRSARALCAWRPAGTARRRRATVGDPPSPRRPDYRGPKR